MEDQNLIYKIEQNDREAFNLLFKKYYKPLVNYIWSLCHDIQLAEDIIQQVFVDLWTNSKPLKISKSVKGYLYWVSFTSYINHYRKTNRRSQLLESFQFETLREAVKEDQDVLTYKVKRLKQIIDTLPPSCREILELNKYRGLQYDEIAEKLNISKKTVESQMRIAFKKIREAFQNEKIILFVFLKSLRFNI